MGHRVGEHRERTPGLGHGHVERGEDALLGAGEAAGDEHQVGRHLAQRVHLALGLAGAPVEVDHLERLGVTLGVRHDLEGVDGPLAHLATHGGDGLELAVVGLLDVRPLRPRVARGALVGSGGHELELAHARGALAHGGTHAVVARVAAADDDDVLTLCRDLGRTVTEHRAGGIGEVIDRIDHAGGVDVLGGEAARRTGAGSHDDGVEAVEFRSHLGIAGVGAQAELDADLLHEVDTARDH